MKKTTLAAAAAVLLTSGVALYGIYPAFAETGPDPMGGAMVTWAQYKRGADMLWTRLDVNKDGVLNAADREAKMMQMFDTFDANHDGSVSRAEFAEHSKAMTEGKGKDGAGPGMEGPPPPMAMGMMMGHGGRMMHKMAEMADANHDQSISRAEFDAAAKARFDKADANHDGKLTAAERRTMWAGMRDGDGWRGRHGHRGMGPGMMGGEMGDMPPPPPPPGA
jgi:hypothetical protein